MRVRKAIPLICLSILMSVSILAILLEEDSNLKYTIHQNLQVIEKTKDSDDIGELRRAEVASIRLKLLEKEGMIKKRGEDTTEDNR